MFSSSLRASLVALVASALAVSAAPSLAVKASIPNVNVDGLENLKVIATVTNTGGETLKLLKDPRGVLSTFPENTFTVTGATGSRPSFNGAKAKYSPAYAAGLDDPSVSTVLAPGASIDVTHDLSAAYNFTLPGAGHYTINPSNLFTYVDADGSPKNLYATVGDVAEVKLSGKLAVSRIHDKRASFNSCSDDQQSQLNDAADGAHSYATNTYAYVSGISSGTQRYTTWFGAYDDGNKGTVEDHFRLISGNDFSSFTFDCSCTDAGVYAYVNPDQFGVIYLCGAFWNAPNTGTDSRAGTIIHESSHFTNNGGTSDYAYGQTAAQQLAINNPSQAIFNADSHEYFAENNPSQD